MQNVTIRLREDLLDELDQEADEEGVSRSEYVRDILEDRHRADDLEGEVERLRERLESREDRVEDLEEQLARRSQIEEKVEEVRMEVKGRQETDIDEDAPFPIRWWRWWQRRQE
jgi:chromosome segregation ATPase